MRAWNWMQRLLHSLLDRLPLGVVLQTRERCELPIHKQPTCVYVLSRADINSSSSSSWSAGTRAAGSTAGGAGALLAAGATAAGG